MSPRLVDTIERVRRSMRHLRASNEPDHWTPVTPKNAKILLVYLFQGLGDALLLAPVVKALLNAGAKAPITLLLSKNGARMWKHIDLPVRVIPATEEVLSAAMNDEARKHSTKRRSKTASSAPSAEDERLSQLREKIARGRFDIAADLTHRQDVGGRSWVVASQAQHRMGWRTDDESGAETGLTFSCLDDRHLALRHFSRDLIRPLVPLGVSEPDFDVPFKEDEKAKERVLAIAPLERRVVLVPGGTALERRWDASHFIDIGRFALGAGKASVVVCGSPAESELIRGITKGIGRGAKAYVGKDLGVLISLIRMASAVVTNDTGPMHVAFLAGVPAVAIFTQMPTTSWGPPRPSSKFAVLNVRDTPGEFAGTWKRLALHHLEQHLRL